MAVGKAPGKVIVGGEHAVVYGRPAIAVPVWQTMACAQVVADANSTGCEIYLRDVEQLIRLAGVVEDNPVATVVRKTLDLLEISDNPPWRIEVSSQIPVASGLGSSAALSAAIVRALFHQAGVSPSPAVVSQLVYASEEYFHGAPSGIDNTVVAYGRPVWFVRGESPQLFSVGAPIVLVIADSGAPGSTREMVHAVRQQWEARRTHYEQLFDAIADVVQGMRDAMLEGALVELGGLFDDNHRLLQKFGVSTADLDQLVTVARAAGAYGAKLSGSGGGGNIIAVVEAGKVDAVRRALASAGALRVIVTTIDVASNAGAGSKRCPA